MSYSTEGRGVFGRAVSLEGRGVFGRAISLFGFSRDLSVKIGGDFTVGEDDVLLRELVDLRAAVFCPASTFSVRETGFFTTDAM